MNQYLKFQKKFLSGVILYKNIIIKFYKTFEDETNQTTYQKNKDKTIKWF